MQLRPRITSIDIGSEPVPRLSRLIGVILMPLRNSGKPGSARMSRVLKRLYAGNSGRSELLLTSVGVRAPASPQRKIRSIPRGARAELSAAHLFVVVVRLTLSATRRRDGTLIGDTRTMATREMPKPKNSELLDPSELLTVLNSYRNGDFSARMAPDKTGLAGKVADTLNEILERQERLSGEIVRVYDAVARDGRINQRISLPMASGGWATSVDSVNQLITDLVQPTAEMGRVIGAVAKGDLGQRMSLEVDAKPLSGEFLKTAKLVNTMAEQLNGFASEVTRVAREVGTEGKLGGQARVKGVAGVWKDLTDSVNSMAGNLTNQVRNIAEVTTGVANGDLSRKITVDARGEILELKNTINTMVDQLNGFAGEVTRVAREVGTDGKLGGQANVRGVAGVWKDLTDSVNSMARNLTGQVRNIAEVTTGVAKGDLSTKITVDAQGEILELKNTINTMVDQLNAFAGEVTRVAREVGTVGKLGGQANVKGVAGVWKDLTESVNSMAGNL